MTVGTRGLEERVEQGACYLGSRAARQISNLGVVLEGGPRWNKSSVHQ